MAKHRYSQDASCNTSSLSESKNLSGDVRVLGMENDEHPR